jgi:hypothetical protein
VSNDRPIIASTSWPRALEFSRTLGLARDQFSYADHREKMKGLRGSGRVVYALMPKTRQETMLGIVEEARVQQLELRVV